MALPVTLKDLIEGLEFQSDEGASYLNTAAGDVVYVTHKELRAAAGCNRAVMNGHQRLQARLLATLVSCKQ